MRRIFVIACAFAVIMAGVFAYNEYEGHRLRKTTTLPTVQATPRTVAVAFDEPELANPSEESELGILYGEHLAANRNTATDVESEISSSSETPDDELCCEEELLPVPEEAEPSTWQEREIKRLIAKHGDIPEIYTYVDLMDKHSYAARRQAEISAEDFLEFLRLGALLDPDLDNIASYEVTRCQFEEHGLGEVRIFAGGPNDPPPHETGRF
jgi:hypothetical protein